MAEDRNNSQGLIGQAHTVEHGSPPVAAASSVATTGGAERNGSPPRGPRTLLLRRGENGFGFTLRHFIVYPPESCCMLPGHERTRIDEPMDTIFVKQVRANSPAAEAGLRTGDRVVSVDGKPTRGEQYAKVVQRIQQAGPWLRLLVVSKEDDILQRYFGETAHNPETNQRPRPRSPERGGQKQRRSISSIPGLSPRARQSWVCSAQTSMPTALRKDFELDRSTEEGGCCGRGPEIRSSDLPKETQHSRRNAHGQPHSYQCAPGRCDSLDERGARLRSLQQAQSYDASPGRPDSKCDKHELYGRSRSESIYSRTNSEQIYDRIKDPIYERVRSGVDDRYQNLQGQGSSQQQQHQFYQAHLPRYPLSRAEPQVPIYRPVAKRVTSRRASEGSTTGSTINDLDTVSDYVSSDALRYREPGSRFSVNSRRDSSPMRSNDGFVSYDSDGHGTSSGNVANNGNASIDDSVIMTRLRKSFEQKEEFLRRPSHPIGWFLPEERSDASARVANSSGNGTGNGPASAIPREFYARPQKLQKQIWPPTDAAKQDLQQQQQGSNARLAQDGRNFFAKHALERTSNCNAQRLRGNASSGEGDCYVEQSSQTEESLPAVDRLGQTSPVVREDRREGCREDSRESLDSKDPDRQQLQRNGGGKSGNFVGTMSKIRENATSDLPGPGIGLPSSERRSIEGRNGASSLPSSPGPDKKEGDKFPVLPQGLQIVSRRAKQFESGRLLSDDDEPTGDRTNLYRSELSRLSNKRSVPNVAVRKREFESKAEAQEPRRVTTRETKSLDSGSGLKGNRVIPVGSRRIHCEPPDTYDAMEESQNPRAVGVDGDEDLARSRIRADSTESWDSASASGSLDVDRHRWTRHLQEEIERRRDAKENDGDDEDDVYVNMTSGGGGGSCGNERSLEKACRRQQRQQDDYAQTVEAGVMPSSENDAHRNGVVFRRQKNTQIADEDRATRRVSYLKATWGERLHVDSDLELSDSEPVVHASRSAHKRWRLPLLRNDIASLRRIFEEVTQSTSFNRNAHRGSNSYPGLEAVTPGIAKDVLQVEREGPLHVKFTVLDGKRSSDRSWKQVWGVLRGPILFFFKDRQNQCPSVSNDGESVAQNVDVRCSLVDIAEDYTKRKHVLRLANPNAEVLLQTEDAASMALWLRSLHEHAAAEKPSEIARNSTLKQQAVPQTPGPSSNSNVAAGQPAANGGNALTVSSQGGNAGGSGQRLSPLPGHKGIKKLTSFRNRSPTGQSPVNKTRKPSQTIESLVSPKTKTWKGRVAKQLRRMHGQTGSPSSPVTQLPPEGATFKVPLELCPPSSFSEYVPLIVEMCTSIVDARGLEVVGIYRVPGNTAAISHLTESVNKGFENINLQDPRWSDVNVISSLLKSFFRQLPDSLLTAELYPMFIDADKVEDPQRRMTTIRKLLRDLPEHHFETLKHLMFHLKRIVEHSEVNKMEAKNLAIVFGPTLVRASGSRDNMVTMVTDMSHQCRIVESLLNNVDWFFSDDDLDDLSRLSVNLSLPADTSEMENATSSNNHNLLLNNIQKVEGVREMASAKDIVSSIISAANRKIQRRRKGQDEPDNEHGEMDKARAKQEADSLANRRSMALNERQCSVSEMVLMHEKKNQFQTRSSDRLASTTDGSSIADPGGRNDGAADRGGNGSREDIPRDKAIKYPSSAAESIQSIQPKHRSAVSSASESSRLSSETGLSGFDASSTLSSGSSNDAKQSNDEIAIRTYAGLSATTQERIRRFEQETKAMLQRDQNRQRREAERREEERRRIEMEWQLAKREMESDDLLDSIVDTTVTTAAYRPSPDRLCPRSTTRIPPLSIAVQQQPTSARRVSQLAGEHVLAATSDDLQDSVMKRMKTETERASEEPLTLPPVRYGSLDSLHETHDPSQSSLSPTGHRRKPLSSDVSDDAGSCFLQWTQKILTINKKLSRHTGNPGFWWYISSHLPGTATPSGAATGAASKTPRGSSPIPMPIPMSVPMPVPIAAVPVSGRVQVPGSSVSDAADVGTSSSVPASELSEPVEPVVPVDSLPSPRWYSSGSGVGFSSSKTLNRFLRGSDLLTSLTTTFDRKWRSLVNSTSQAVRGSATATTATEDDGLLLSDGENSVTGDSQGNGRQQASRGEREERKTSAVQPEDFHSHSIDVYRDPSLHKTSIEKRRYVCRKNDVPEKDTDSSVVEIANVERLAGDTPDNDRSALVHRMIESTKKNELLRPSKEPVDEAALTVAGKTAEEVKGGRNEVDASYSNKLEKFESLTNLEARTRLKRSESLNKKSDNVASKLRRSESLNKHSAERLSSPTNGKLKRSESLNKHSERSDSPSSKLRRSESLTKTEKTESNISKRRQSVRKDSATKLKRKNGMPERSIKRRHTVGGTKDFDKVHWLDNKLQVETERVVRSECRPKKSQLRTSSPDLSTGRFGLTDASFLIEVSFRGPSNVVFNVTNARPQSLPDTSIPSKVFKVPLESHV